MAIARFSGSTPLNKPLKSLIKGFIMTYSTGSINHQPASFTTTHNSKGHTMRTLAQSTAIVNHTLPSIDIASLVRVASLLVLVFMLLATTGCSNYTVNEEIPTDIQAQIDADEDYYELTDEDLLLLGEYDQLDLSNEEFNALSKSKEGIKEIKRWIQEIRDITINGLDTFHEVSNNGSCESDVHTEVENGDNTLIIQHNQITGYCYIGWDK